MSNSFRTIGGALVISAGVAVCLAGCGSEEPTATPAPAESGKMSGGAMEKDKMGGMDSGKMGGMEKGKMDGMDSGKMGGMEKGKMDGMDSGKMGGMEKGKMEAVPK